MSSITKKIVEKDFTMLSRLFLKGDIIYVSDSIYTMDGIFDYRRDIFDDSRKKLGSIRDSYYLEEIKNNLKDN